MGCAKLNAALQSEDNSLEVLCLHGNSFGNEGSISLSYLLRNHKRLRMLGCSDTSLTDEGAAFLLDAAKDNTGRLNHLDISHVSLLRFILNVYFWTDSL